MKERLTRVTATKIVAAKYLCILNYFYRYTKHYARSMYQSLEEYGHYIREIYALERSHMKYYFVIVAHNVKNSFQDL